MSAINLVITAAGLAALVDPESGGTNAVTITELGVTDEAFDLAPTLEELPGEIKRIDGLAGESIGLNVIHMVVHDDSTDAYSVRGIGLYLSDGTLFAIFGQADPIFEKSSLSSFLLAADITFADDVAGAISFGDTNFLYPPATETTRGVAYLASDADVEAGVDTEKIVTPAQLAGSYIPLAQRGVAGGVATLDGTGRVPPAQLPAVDSIDTFTADSQAAMLALDASPGDFCLRTDLEETFILVQAPATTLANWQEFLSPGAPVRTVNGKIGDVVLSPGDVGAVATTRSIAAAGLATGGGTLAADRTITVPKASKAEVNGGAIDTKAVTPAGLADIIAGIAAKLSPTRRVDTSGLATGGGDLSDDRTIAVAKASKAEVNAGVEDAKAVTPAGLADIIAAIAAKPGASRRVDTSGLATGGGDLSADRVIGVPKASAADVMAGTDDTKAVTSAALWGTLRTIGLNGQLQIPGTPIILKWGVVAVPGAQFSNTVLFPVAFPHDCWHVFLSYYGNPNNGDESDEPTWVSWPIAAGSFTINGAGDRVAMNVGWLAIGR